MLILWKSAAKRPRGRLRHDVPAPDRGRARHLHRPGHPHRHQRRRAQPGRAAPTPCASSPSGSASTRRSPTSRATTCSPASPSCRPQGHDLAHLDTGRAARRRRASSRSPPTPTSAAAASPPRSTRAPTSWSARASPTPRSWSGPAAWWHGWARDDWDRLAGAVVAGHVLECGAQATGGNYAFFTRGARPRPPGLPARRGQRRRLAR